MSDINRCTTEYHELISGYIDGDLDAPDRQRLLDHLANCQDCRATLEAYRRIGNQVRSLPRAVPPAELRNAIYAATIESQPRKVYLLTSRLGYSVAALAAVLLIFIVAIYLLVNGYQRSIDPEVVGSQPGNGVIWPLSRPIEISFNKEMDRDSVESALSITPASEKDRLTRTWEGNTLIIGQSQTLRSGASYTVRITTNAEDKWGKRLGSEFQLQFESSDTFALETPVPIPTATETPVPLPTSTATPTEAGQPGPTSTPESAATPPAAATVEPTPDASGPTATEAPVALAPTPTPTAIIVPTEVDPIAPPAPPAATSTPVPQLPTEEPTNPPATATERPTSTPAPTWTPRPIPSPTPTTQLATSTPTTPPPTATPETIPVVGAFGNVYWSNEIVSSRLGAPLAAAASTTGVELDFQHGAMFSRSDTGQTYILESASGVWSSVASSSGSASSEPGPDPDTWIPGGSLGDLWSTESWIQSALGYALSPSGTVFDSRAQRFENGTMLLSSSGQVYVIYGNGTWELYPDPGA